MYASISLWSGSPAHAGETSASIAVNDLKTLIGDVDMSKVGDPFDVSPSHAMLSGKTFSIDIMLRNDRVPGWSYDAIGQRMTIRPGSDLFVQSTRLPPRFARAHQGRKFLEGYAFHEQVISKSDYIGTTAFGGMTNVRSTAQRRYAVAELGKSPFIDTFDEFTISIAPERARALTGKLTLRVQGNVVPADGQAVGCFDDLKEATFNSPKEELVRTCIVSARFTSVEIIDAASGEILFDRP